jgi:hypothetical protein
MISEVFCTRERKRSSFALIFSSISLRSVTRLPDDLFCPLAEDAFRPAVEPAHYPVGRYGHDRVEGRVKCGSAPRSFLARHQVADERMVCASNLSFTPIDICEKGSRPADPHGTLPQLEDSHASNVGRDSMTEPES